MRNNVTEIIFLLDRSGSMSGLERDTIGGFNSFIERQCQTEGDTVLTTVLFDHDYELLWNGVDASKVKLTEKEYQVRGTTALLDAVGRAILDVGYRLSRKAECRKPDQVMFVITTDGLENASREFTYAKIKELITHQQKKHDWQFIFMGANIDAAEEADSIGIARENAVNFEASAAGVEAMYDTVSEMVLENRKKQG